MYTATQIAYFFIRRASNENKDLTHLKLQKLLYLAYGHYAAATGQKLFDDPIEAWQYGPVVNSVYHIMKRYGNKDIIVYINSDAMLSTENIEYAVSCITSEDRNFLNTIWDVYGDLTASQLVHLTHKIGSTWDFYTNSGTSIGVNDKIDFEDIKSEFLSRMPSASV